MKKPSSYKLKLVQHAKVCTREMDYEPRRYRQALQDKYSLVPFGEFTLKKGLMSVRNVENALVKRPHLLHTRGFILEKKHTNVANVGSHSVRAPTSLNTVNFTVEKGLECGELWMQIQSCLVSENTLGRGHMNVTNVRNCSGKASALLNISESTPWRGRMCATSVRNPLVKKLLSLSMRELTLEKG